MPSKSANVKNKKQYEALKDKGMSKQRAAKIANSPKASKHGGDKSHSGDAVDEGSIPDRMPLVRVDTFDTRELLQQGAHAIEVLPESNYRAEHLPAARSVPL